MAILKYELIGTNDYKVFPIETVLNNRGVEDIDAYLNVGKHNEHHYSLLDNIDNAVDMILEHLKKGNNILLIVDSDFDGKSSSAIMWNYIKRIYPDANLTFHIHKEKIHGVFDRDVSDNIDLVIIPDAATNNYADLKLLNNRGIEACVLDHHTSNNPDYDYGDKTVVVNNQLSDNYPNKELCGAGVVYKVCQAIDDKLGVSYANDYLDLVAMANIADMMSVKSLETRYYILEGLKDKSIKNPFIKSIIERMDFFIKGEINTKTVGWNIAPIINGTIRYGTQEEKEDMFRAFIETCEKTIPYKPRGSDEEVDQSISEAMARVCTNAKGRQDRARKKAAKELEELIEDNNLADNNILVINATDKLTENLTGLVAMELAQEYKRPTLVLHKKLEIDEEGNEQNVYRGSGRNFRNSPIEDLRSSLDELDIFNYVQGHPSAYGIEVDEVNFSKAIKKANETFDGVDFNENYIVDFVIPGEELKPNTILELGGRRNLWGHEVEEPTVVVKGITISTDKINLIGRHKNTIKFEHNGVEFIKFRSSQQEFDDLIKSKDTASITLVGKCDINEWQGNKTAQIIIDDWHITDMSEVEDLLKLF